MYILIHFTCTNDYLCLRWYFSRLCMIEMVRYPNQIFVMDEKTGWHSSHTNFSSFELFYGRFIHLINVFRIDSTWREWNFYWLLFYVEQNFISLRYFHIVLLKNKLKLQSTKPGRFIRRSIMNFLVLKSLLIKIRTTNAVSFYSLQKKLYSLNVYVHILN